jgi:hypothetical protein
MYSVNALYTQYRNDVNWKSVIQTTAALGLSYVIRGRSIVKRNPFPYYLTKLQINKGSGKMNKRLGIFLYTHDPCNYEATSIHTCFGRYVLNLVSSFKDEKLIVHLIT